LPHDPQLRASLAVLTQAPAQKVVPPPQMEPHDPPEHAVPGGQLTPQRPQLTLLLERLTSQPSASLPLQLSKPGEQAPSRHAPPAHDAPALGRLHARPHAPQLLTSAPTLVSQPSASTPLQLEKPPLHAPMRQLASAHTVAALARRHARPQAPQCSMAARRLVSQPVEATLSQSPKPALQVSPHTPPRHAGSPLAPPGHARPHVPQCCASVSSVAQRSPQKVVPPPQIDPQAPIEHAVPAGQRLPQRPQLALSELTGVSQPFIPSPSQLSKPARHPARAQRPSTHAGLPLGYAHATPHAPQLVALVAVAVSQPLLGSLSQSPAPGAHWIPHTPIAQVAVAPGPDGHARPHIPQCDALVVRGVSQPLAALPSQSPKPPAHSLTHAPITQRPVALGPPAQARPHAPQCIGSLWKSASQPLPPIRSQSP
jgi:hypothetical protein